MSELENNENPLEQAEHEEQEKVNPLDPGFDEKENYDFDFSLYEREEEDEETQEDTLVTRERPRISGMRSRFSNGLAELERLALLGTLITKYSIQVETRTQDINLLWKYYGSLSEMWELIRNIPGELVNAEINKTRKTARLLLEEYNDKKPIHHKVHNNLLFFRSQLYRLRQLINLGFEVDRTNRGAYGKAKRAIIQ